MQQQQHARKHTRHGAGDDDDERVVYYDVNAGSQRQNPLLYSPEDARGNARSTANAKSHSRRGSGSHRTSSSAAGKRAASAGSANGSSGILERPKEIFHQQPLFQLDPSDGEDDDNKSEDENPFASLLQQPTRKQKPVDAYEEEGGDDVFDAVIASASTKSSSTAGRKSQSKSIARKSTSPVRITPPRRSGSIAVSPGEGTGRNSTRRERLVKPAVVSGIPKRLSVEAADARPSRWSQKSTAVAKKGTDRRKSVPNALQKNRQAQTGGPRRTSLPLSLMTESRQQTQDGGSQSGPKKRRLADVLMRATLLSQQKTQDERPSQHHDNSRESSFTIDNEDAIVDTEHQMREEKFDTPIFSPSKLNNNPSAASRKKQQKPDAAATKIRGELGEVIARAIRKSNRDLTLLHSHGQTLVEQTRDAGGYSIPGGLDRVQDRDFTVIRLRHQVRQGSDEQIVYDGTVQELSPGAQSPCKEEKTSVRVAFSSQTAAHLSLKPNALVKIYAPFHFIPFEQAAGSSSVKKKNKWLLLGTTLSEIVQCC